MIIERAKNIGNLRHNGLLELLEKLYLINKNRIIQRLFSCIWVENEEIGENGKGRKTGIHLLAEFIQPMQRDDLKRSRILTFDGKRQ